MAEDMFRQGPLWVDSGYRGECVRQSLLKVDSRLERASFQMSGYPTNREETLNFISAAISE